MRTTLRCLQDTTVVSPVRGLRETGFDPPLNVHTKVAGQAGGMSYLVIDGSCNSNGTCRRPNRKQACAVAPSNSVRYLKYSRFSWLVCWRC
jgi:hypothetical protein